VSRRKLNSILAVLHVPLILELSDETLEVNQHESAYRRHRKPDLGLVCESVLVVHARIVRAADLDAVHEELLHKEGVDDRIPRSEEVVHVRHRRRRRRWRLLGRVCFRQR
jgi:hypothetical protein